MKTLRIGLAQCRQTASFDANEKTIFRWRGLAGKTRGWFLAAFADSSVRVLPHSLTPATLRALFTRASGDVVPEDF